jgi:hypothetical protein
VDADRGLAEAGKVEDPYFADQARGRIALYLAPRDPKRALTIAQAIERSVLQADPLAACIPGLAARNPAKAYEAASQILSRRARAEALLAIALALPETKPEGQP